MLRFVARPGCCRILVVAAIVSGWSAIAAADNDLRPSLLDNEKFLKHLAGCTRQHGYDPTAQNGLGPHELGRNEMPWRECAYEGIRRIIVPASALPEMYEDLIAEDRKMTEAVVQGTMTRDDRRSRIEVLTGTAAVNEQLNKSLQQRKAADEFFEREKKRILEMRRDDLIYGAALRGSLGR
jgi:hypothetical protein